MIPDRPVETPALLLDLDVMEKISARMADLARRGGVSFRPHIKTHKSLPIAHRQLLQGARGVTAATLAEAELMAQGGIRDILLAYPPVGSLKLKRLLDPGRLDSSHPSPWTAWKLLGLWPRPAGSGA